MPDISPVILGTVEASPELLSGAGIYCNVAVGDDNLFAELFAQQLRVYLFNAYHGLYRLDVSELQHVFRLRTLSAAALRRLPLNYLLPALQHSRLVYQSYFKDDEQYAPNISWEARDTALERGAKAPEAKRYRELVELAFGCLAAESTLTREGTRLAPHGYRVQPASMARNLTNLAKLDLLTFTREADSFTVRFATRYLRGLDAQAMPRFFA